MVPGHPIRRVMKITRDSSGAITATIYSIDETDDPIPVSTITQDGSALKMRLDVNQGEWRDYHRTYTATVSSGGQSISGTWVGPGESPMQMDFQRTDPAHAWPIPPVPASHLVTVAPGVQLELVDWGGTGKPIVFLAGLGNTAHIFSGTGFARDFTRSHHVYGITRRGFGESSKPAFTPENYSADRLGDDVVAVLDAMHIERPVLIGHSIAGEELSSIGTRYPNKISGLVYLDAGYSYALYDPHAGSFERLEIDEVDLKRDLADLDSGNVNVHEAAASRMLNADLARVRQGLRVEQAFEHAMSPQMRGAIVQTDPLSKAIIAGEEKYTGPIHVPVLAIYAAPHDWSSALGPDKAADSAAEKMEYADQLTQIEAFRKHVPSAQVIRIPNADHYVFFSNRAEVERDVNAFLNALP